MKMNIGSAMRRDTVGFFTHFHRRATWRQDFQEKIVKELRANMSADEISEAMKAADDSLYVAKAQGRNCIVYAEITSGQAAA